MKTADYEDVTEYKTLDGYSATPDLSYVSVKNFQMHEYDDNGTCNIYIISMN